MTHEEAIEKIQIHLAYMRQYEAPKTKEALDMAISALREQEERSKGCGWCKRFAGVPLRGFTEHGCQSITVKFCPMCGRRLEEV